MSDNPTSTATSRKVAADEVTYSGDTADVQLVRPVHVSGAEGSKVVHELSDLNGAYVKLNSRDQLLIQATSAGLTTAATAYTTGDQVGNIFTLANAGRTSGAGGRITSVTLVDAADLIGAYDVVFFDSTVTLAADNAAFAISDADALKYVGLAPLSGSWDIGNNRIAQLLGCSIPYKCNGGTDLFAALICRVGHSFFAAVGNLQLNVTVERD